jgi:predicted O-methyltransferase YrrM
MTLEPILDFAHTLATRALRAGDVAVDATIGNGHDTLVLAQTVGEDGHVHGFDVQAPAFEQTQARLRTEGVAERVTLHEAGHQRMEQYVPEAAHGAVGAVTFNLGYLPGSDSTRTTTPETTVPALDAALDLLRPGGVITTVLYTGHEGGAEEARAVQEWAAALAQERAEVLSYRFLNQQNAPPRLLAVEKQDPDGAS